jgi:hypothetical protein
VPNASTSPPTRLVYAVVVLAIQTAILLLPSVCYIVYAQSFHRGQFLWELPMAPLFLATCALSGACCHRQLRQANLHQHYAQTMALGMGRLLVVLGLVLGLLTLASALAHTFRPLPVPLPECLLAGWILMLAVVVPVDAAGLFDQRRMAMFLAAITPWAFCIAYPLYIWARPDHSRLSVTFAILAVVLTLTGWAIWCAEAY